MSQGADIVPAGKFRLVTRGDFDGIVCAALLREHGLVDAVSFVHPKDMQDGKVRVGPDDITTNLPYVPGCHLAFDHHASEMKRQGSLPDNFIIDPAAPSTARVVYDHYGGAAQFPSIPTSLMDAVDKADSANFSQEEVLNPLGWVLLNFILDSRTGLGRFRDFRISNEELLMQMVDALRAKDIDEILLLPDVSERVRLYFEHESYFRSQIQQITRMEGPVAVLDLREEEPIYAGNRFMVYAMHPQCAVSIHVLHGPRRESTVFAIGRSILNHTSTVDIGALCLRYGGGGHAGAGTCQVDPDEADSVLAALIEALQAD